jgi:arylsulfatase A-like enzyme
MNIIVIISDTFRQDHLGCYGNEKIYTPHLDKLASMSVQFDNCYCTSFPTIPMRADLFTGKYTFTYLGWNALPRSEKILSALLQEAGYKTIAAVDTPFFLRHGYGYDRGFRDFRFIDGQWGAQEGQRVMFERRYEKDYFAPRTITAAEELLEFHHKEKFFLHIDMWDPHEPWDPPDWYVEPYYSGYDGRVVHPAYWDYKERGVSEEDLKIAHACYCGEITMVDQWVGRFLGKIESMGLWDDTVIVFTTDHGYFFGEHGFFGKGRVERSKDILYKYGDQVWVQSPLYQELIRVPLLISVPGVPPKREKSLVSLVDLMPTLLDLVGEEIPDTVQGRSMLSLIKGDQDSFRDHVVSSFPLYMSGEKTRIVDGELRSVEDPHFSTVTTPKWSFLFATENYPAQLYDLENDPKETKNIITQNWTVAEELHRKFIELLEWVGTDEKYLSERHRLKQE